MDSPIRIQRKRTKGWTMPANTIYVGRPSIFANPFKHLGPRSNMVYADASNRRGRILSKWVLHCFGEGNEILVKCYEDWMNGIVIQEDVSLENIASTDYMIEPPSIAYVKSMLKGKNLACWCSLDKPCHADILLKIANG